MVEVCPDCTCKLGRAFRVSPSERQIGCSSGLDGPNRDSEGIFSLQPVPDYVKGGGARLAVEDPILGPKTIKKDVAQKYLDCIG